jgi:hypothetical protein
MTVGQGTNLIDTVSRFIDANLSDIYGTVSPLFGTNAYGTGAVDKIIEDICADLTLGMAFENTTLTIPERQATWGKGIYDRGLDWLEKLVTGEWSVTGFSGSVLTANPSVSGGECQVYGESKLFDGTNLNYLNNLTVIDNSVIVYGTQTFSPPVYRRGIDYNYFAYNKELQGTLSGYICSTGSGSITGSFPVRIDYQYKALPIFELNDFYKWGETSKEKRG